MDKKLAFAFWGGPQPSLLNIISLLSFAIKNPDTKLIVYTINESVDLNSGWKTNEYSYEISKTSSLSELERQPNIIVEYLDLEGSIKELSSIVHVACYVCIQKLYEHGGIWIDTDVLFVKKIPDSVWNLLAKDGFWISYRNTITNGIMGFPRHSEFMRRTLIMANQMIDKGGYQNDYQAFGPNLWRDAALINADLSKDIAYLSEKLIYPFLFWDADLNKFYFREDDSFEYDETIGMHWYGGHNISRSFIDKNLEFMLTHQHPNTNFLRAINRIEGMGDISRQLIANLKPS